LLSRDKSYYDDFPIVGLNVGGHSLFQSWKPGEEISFSGQRQQCCVCFIDMMDSTKIASKLSSTQISKYYGFFLNAMATIARNFGAKIIKNAGDCLIFYFPKTSSSDNISTFREVLECGSTMIAAHKIINAKMNEEELPVLNYRISADYGDVEFAKSSSSQSDDLFGSTINLCAKINSKAPENGMVIGSELYQIVKSLNTFTFEKIEGFFVGGESHYHAYIVRNKEKRTILNPFKHYPENESNNDLTEL
jgi:class 3 adenylate cyclase